MKKYRQDLTEKELQDYAEIVSKQYLMYLTDSKGNIHELRNSYIRDGKHIIGLVWDDNTSKHVYCAIYAALLQFKALVKSDTCSDLDKVISNIVGTAEFMGIVNENIPKINSYLSIYCPLMDFIRGCEIKEAKNELHD